MPSAPLRLRCEFVNNPLGVTTPRPRLSWWVNDPRPAELQSAYEIMAASTLARLDADDGDVWHSRVESNVSAHVPFGGGLLKSAQRVWWKVRTFDSDGLGSPWSAPAFFEMGLLHADDWQAHWIAATLRGSRSRAVHAVALRREFVLTEPVQSARLYLAALGDYRLEINGQTLPGTDANAIWCNYDDEVYYQSFDVTGMLLNEPNAIGIVLGDGYYAGMLPLLGRGNYGERPQLKLRLDITFVDGRRQTVSSDHQWHWCPSWILAAETNAGEHVDARQLVAGWSEAGLDERHWSTVDVLPDDARALRAQPFPDFAVQQVLRPLTLPRNSRADGRMVAVYDFGDQVLGRARLDLVSREADEVLLTYCLDDSFKEVTTDSYTSAGLAQGETFEGAFALHGFRYLRVTYTPGVTEIRDTFALRISALDGAGVRVRCDHPSLNQLFEVVDNSLRAVTLSVPMRGLAVQQRLPDVAYAGTWLPLLAQQERAHTLIGKYLEDIRQDCQSERSGAHVPQIARAVGAHPGDAMARFETLAKTLWSLYRYQNDLPLLKRMYPELRVAALSYRHSQANLLREDADPELYGDKPMNTLVATCTLYGALRLTARIAGVLTFLGDYELIEALAEDVRKAFRRRYLTRDGHLAADAQSACVAVLYHNLLEADERLAVEQRLVELLQENRYHADVAPAVLHALLPVLTQAGRLDTAYMVLLQTSAPSWLATVNAGSRLIGQERGVFDIAHVGIWEWLLEAMVGIRLHEDYSVDRNGFKTVRVQPIPPLGQQFLAGSPVQFVEASLQTLYGVYEVTWSILDNQFELELKVPPGCTALVTMPDEIEQTVQSGQHRFMMNLGEGGDGVPTLLELAGDEPPPIARDSS